MSKRIISAIVGLVVLDSLIGPVIIPSLVLAAIESVDSRRKRTATQTRSDGYR